MPKREMRCPHKDKISDCAGCMAELNAMTPLPTQPDELHFLLWDVRHHKVTPEEAKAAIVSWALGIIGEDDVSGGNPGYTFKEQHRNELRSEQRERLEKELTGFNPEQKGQHE